MDALLRCLRDRTPMDHPAALVVAHPDDETIAAGGSLHLLPRLLLVHVTDGAPRDGQDAASHGFPNPDAYAAAREAELAAALALAGTNPDRAALGIADQDASLHIPAIAARLAQLFCQHGVRHVLTHAYEGGHPDHDAVALAVHLAARNGPAVLEFAGYHAAPDGSLRTGRFLPGPPGHGIGLSGADAERKAAMLRCFHTQATILGHFSKDREAFRPAPDYDFTVPPHPGLLNYEHWGWTMTGERWRGLAAAALDRPCCAA